MPKQHFFWCSKAHKSVSLWKILNHLFSWQFLWPHQIFTTAEIVLLHLQDLRFRSLFGSIWGSKSLHCACGGYSGGEVIQFIGQHETKAAWLDPTFFYPQNVSNFTAIKKAVLSRKDQGSFFCSRYTHIHR